MAIKKLSDVKRAFPTEEACLAYLAEQRWPGGQVTCPRCNSDKKVYALKARPYRWVCKACAKNGYRFSPLVGTIYENTNVPLRTWFRVIYLVTVSKKGVSAMQVQRMIDPSQGGTKVSYRTAWYMLHRIRAAMKDDDVLSMMLTGEVEVDETFVGGKNRNRHGGGRGMMKRTGKRTINRDDKMPVIGAIARKGNVIARAMGHVTGKHMRAFVKEVVSDKVSLVATDDHVGYRLLGAEGFPHESVSHSHGEYVRGNVHTANLDQFWSLLKRGVIGTYHQISWDYLPLYLAEFSYRHNHRNDADMFQSVIAGC
jgi:transposase-like protein